MKNVINLGSIKMPKEAATKGFALIGKRGSGKTYNGAVMAEEFAKHGIPFVVFDPIDVWWGLRLKADGKSKGLPIVVFGLQHSDIPLDRTMGKKIAQAVVKENISCVISTFGMPKVAMRELIADFSEELLNINNTPRHVFIEEAHEFVPQRVFGAGARCFAAVEALLVMGRNRGIGVTLLNQRMATLNKDLVTQVDTLLAFRSVGPQDRKALKEWVEAHSAEGDFDAFMKSIPSLPTGEGWIWSPEFMGVFERIKIRKRETFHPDREKLGVSFKMPEIKQGDIQSFIDKFSLKPEKKIVAGNTRNFPLIPDRPAYDRRLAKEELAGEYKRGFNEGEYTAERKFKLLRDKIYQELIRSHGNADVALQRVFASIEKLNEKDSSGRLVAGNQVKRSSFLGVKPGTAGGTGYREVGDNHVDEGGKLSGGALRMLRVLEARAVPLTRQQLATMADVKLTGGSFSTYISRLKAAGYIEVTSEAIAITPEGSVFIGPQDNTTNPRDVQSMWLSKMTGGANRMLKVLIENYPNVISRQDLSDWSDVSMTGGSWTTYLSRLKGNGLITVTSEGVKASPTLFEV